MSKKLLVTGSRHGRPDVEWWLELWLKRQGAPTQFICGDQTGVDSQAFVWASAVLPASYVVREVVKHELPSPRRFHERDQRMADHVGPGDWCLAFPVDGSRGTWLTVNMCKKRGASVYVCPLRRPER